eukprot:9294539-Pyramimonas_sp.AAC.1
MLLSSPPGHTTRQTVHISSPVATSCGTVRHVRAIKSLPAGEVSSDLARVVKQLKGNPASQG